VNGIARRARLARSRLYLILEARPHGGDPGPLLEGALRGGVDVVQLREKGLSDGELVRAAEPFRRACAAYGALFILNDRPDLVERCGADGVHVGQDDVPLAEARRIVGAERLVGLSATTSQELRGDPDYFGVGAIEWSLAAGAIGARPHTHAAHTDVFSVVDGELEFRVGEETVLVPAASCVAAPPLLVHGFRNPSGRDTRLVNMHAPGVWARGRRRFEPHEFDTFGLDRAQSGARGVVTGPGDGDRVAKEHRLALVKLRSNDLDVLEYHVAPGYSGADEHVHLGHADCFRILEGALDFTVAGRNIRAETGTTVIVPPGIVHGFSGAGPARFLNVHAPSFGFAEYLRAVDAGADVDAARHDMFDPPA
jgi:thiamine-phosphate pyrophosphorylase